MLMMSLFHSRNLFLGSSSWCSDLASFHSLWTSSSSWRDFAWKSCQGVWLSLLHLFRPHFSVPINFLCICLNTALCEPFSYLTITISGLSSDLLYPDNPIYVTFLKDIYLLVITNLPDSPCWYTRDAAIVPSIAEPPCGNVYCKIHTWIFYKCVGVCWAIPAAEWLSCMLKICSLRNACADSGCLRKRIEFFNFTYYIAYTFYLPIGFTDLRVVLGCIKDKIGVYYSYHYWTVN